MKSYAKLAVPGEGVLTATAGDDNTVHLTMVSWDGRRNFVMLGAARAAVERFLADVKEGPA
jgi:hypothetical protein